MKKEDKQKVGLGVGLGLAAIAAGAGYYFYGSKAAVQNRKKAGKWAHDIKADVIKKAKKLEKFDKKAYNAIVDESVKGYKAIKSIDPANVAVLASELKSNWDNLSAEFTRAAKKNTVVAKKAVHKAVVVAKKAVAKAPVKKVAKKVAKKKA